MFGVFFLGSLYLERVLGYSPLEIGLAFLPVTVVMGTLSIRYSEPLVMRFGARNSVLATLSSSRSDALRDGGASVASALTGGYQLAYLIGAALVLAAILVGLAVVRSDRPAVERRRAAAAVAEAAYAKGA